MSSDSAYLIVNFGGPRHLEEIPEFLIELLTDQDVIRTGWPRGLQTVLFRYIARKRAKKAVGEYALIGGGSPIFQDTEFVAKAVSQNLNKKVLTFHRYLPETHRAFMEEMQALTEEQIIVFPMFPQFSYATTGSIARWFQEHLCGKTLRKLRWIKSYPRHPRFIACHQNAIRQFLEQRKLSPEEVFLFFSAHGLPRQFICMGDMYESECEISFRYILAGLSHYKGLLAYQSKFGSGEWLRPYTDEMCKKALLWHEGKQHIVFVPMTFTSDHIETLFEIEQQYLPVIRQQGFIAHRCPALGLQKEWIEAIAEIMHSSDLLGNDMLIRHKRKKCCSLCRGAFCCSC